MANTIPYSQLATVIPGVVNAGGNPLSLNAVMLDQASLTPIGLLQFTNPSDVGSYYGLNSSQYQLAVIYFNGFDNSTKKPGTLYFAGYATAAVAAWIRGQSLAGTTLAQIQAITGSLSITIDGVVKSAASLNLSAATSFVNAASLISTALSLSGGAAVTWDAQTSRFVVTSGTTGSTSSVSFASGTAAAPLGLTAGIQSFGTAADTPATAMARIANATQDWATFMTTWLPSLSDMTNFAIWSNAQQQRFVYITWDSAAGYTTANNPAVFGTIVATVPYNGTCVFYGPDPSIAAMVCGTTASIDWTAFNGRISFAFKSQSGLNPTVTDLGTANAVLSNNASYYGLYSGPGTGNTGAILYDGRMNGSGFKWLDTFVDGIKLNTDLVTAIFNGLKNANSVPYNTAGTTLMRSWCQDPINAALNNGIIRTGVLLSQSQITQIMSQAGLDISTQLQTQGYYLQILPATAQVRQGRQSPPCKLWYMDGGSVQQITLASIVVL